MLPYLYFDLYHSTSTLYSLEYYTAIHLLMKIYNIYIYLSIYFRLLWNQYPYICLLLQEWTSVREDTWKFYFPKRKNNPTKTYTLKHSYISRIRDSCSQKLLTSSLNLQHTLGRFLEIHLCVSQYVLLINLYA